METSGDRVWGWRRTENAKGGRASGGGREREKERTRRAERERDSAERRCNSVGLCIESAVAGRTCRDHGGLMRLRKRRPHGQADAFQSRLLVRSFLHAVTVSKLGRARILPAVHHAVSSPFGFRETRAYVIPEINLVKHSARHPPFLSIEVEFDRICFFDFAESSPPRRRTTNLLLRWWRKNSRSRRFYFFNEKYKYLSLGES